MPFTSKWGWNFNHTGISTLSWYPLGVPLIRPNSQACFPTYEIYALEIKSPLHIVGLEHKLSLDIRNDWRPNNSIVMTEGLITVRLWNLHIRNDWRPNNSIVMTEGLITVRLWNLPITHWKGLQSPFLLGVRWSSPHISCNARCWW